MERAQRNAQCTTKSFLCLGFFAHVGVAAVIFGFGTVSPVIALPTPPSLPIISLVADKASRKLERKAGERLERAMAGTFQFVL